jgi:hypothetical protein
VTTVAHRDAVALVEIADICGLSRLVGRRPMTARIRVHTIVVATGGSATTDGGPRTAGRGRRLQRQRRRGALHGAVLSSTPPWRRAALGLRSRYFDDHLAQTTTAGCDRSWCSPLGLAAGRTRLADGGHAVRARPDARLGPGRHEVAGGGALVVCERQHGGRGAVRDPGGPNWPNGTADPSTASRRRPTGGTSTTSPDDFRNRCALRARRAGLSDDRVSVSAVPQAGSPAGRSPGRRRPASPGPPRRRSARWARRGR